MKKLRPWLYLFAVIIFSALLIAFAYDIEKGTPIELSNTQAGRQKVLMKLAEILGLKGSIAVTILVTGACLFNAISKHRFQVKKS